MLCSTLFHAPSGVRKCGGWVTSRASHIAHGLPHLDPFSAVSHLQNLHVLTLADINPETAADAAQAAAQGAAAAKGAGPFDWLAKAFEASLTAIDSGLEALHIPYSYGFSIIILTVLVKIATFPLTQKQVESTLKVQAISPRVKELQAKFANDSERLQLETAKLYREANVNPLAGCLPTLATIPVFIGLYRALTLAAQDGLLIEGFFFVPSLGGPATIEQQLSGQGLTWLLPFVDGTPPLGWETTLKYLALPIALVVSQYAALTLAQPPQTDDPAAKQTQNILKFLPIMIGWFSLNVPSGLCIYWLTNNVLSTAQQLYLKRNTKVDVPTPSGTYIKARDDNVIDVTADSSPSTRRSQQGEKFRARKAGAGASDGPPDQMQDPRGKKKKGAKFAARKAAQAKASEGRPASAVDSVQSEPGAPVKSSSSSTEQDGMQQGTEEPAVAVAEKKASENGSSS